MFTALDRPRLSPWPLRSSGTITMPASIAADGECSRTGAPSSSDRTLVVAVHTGDGAHHLGPPGADKAGDAEDLAAGDGEVDAGEGALAAQAADLEDHVLQVRFRGVVLEGEIAPDHRRHHLRLRDVAAVPGLHQVPVAQADDLRADVAHLLEAVRDVDDADPALGHPADLVQDQVGLVTGQGGRRFVEDDVPRACGRWPWRSRCSAAPPSTARRRVAADPGRCRARPAPRGTGGPWTRCPPCRRGPAAGRGRCSPPPTVTGTIRISWWMIATPRVQGVRRRRRRVRLAVQGHRRRRSG